MKRALAAAIALLVLWASAAAAAFPNTGSVVQPNSPVSAILIEGMDMHEGTVQKWGDTYYMYGSMNGCGFRWQQSSPWCGLGVSTAPALEGPWTAPTLLFAVNSVSPFRNQTWQQLCGNTGAACTNPRMIRRDFQPHADGIYILWFNAPADYNQLQANAYYAMGCAGPAGPCGNGVVGGTTNKPALSKCYGNGDFSLVVDGTTAAYIVCTQANQTFAIEKLDEWGTNGVGVGAFNLAGLTNVESPGIYYDQGAWILTYSDPNCGYCAGNGTSYATASSITGPYTAPANTGYSADPRGRRMISATSCGGQPRTVFMVDGQQYEWVDLWGVWNGSAANQALANILLVPLEYTPSASPVGGVRAPQFAQWPCS